MKFNTQYANRRVIEVTFTEPTMTKQAPANEVDINAIMDRYLKTGELPVPRPAQYGDATEIPSYEEAMNIVNQAREDFEALPAKIRERFDNDPGKMLAFIGDDANYEEALALGLVEKRQQAVESADASVATQAEAPKADA